MPYHELQKRMGNHLCAHKLAYEGLDMEILYVCVCIWRQPKHSKS